MGCGQVGWVEVRWSRMGWGDPGRKTEGGAEDWDDISPPTAMALSWVSGWWWFWLGSRVGSIRAFE